MTISDWRRKHTQILVFLEFLLRNSQLLIKSLCQEMRRKIWLDCGRRHDGCDGTVAQAVGVQMLCELSSATPYSKHDEVDNPANFLRTGNSTSKLYHPTRTRHIITCRTEINREDILFMSH